MDFTPRKEDLKQNTKEELVKPRDNCESTEGGYNVEIKLEDEEDDVEESEEEHESNEEEEDEEEQESGEEEEDEGNGEEEDEELEEEDEGNGDDELEEENEKKTPEPKKPEPKKPEPSKALLANIAAMQKQKETPPNKRIVTKTVTVDTSQTKASTADVPCADLYDLGNKYVLIVDMPGCTQNEIDMKIKNEATGNKFMLICGNRKDISRATTETSRLQYFLLKERVIPLEKSIQLPIDARTDTYSAVCDEGLLIITLDKVVLLRNFEVEGSRKRQKVNAVDDKPSYYT